MANEPTPAQTGENAPKAPDESPPAAGDAPDLAAALGTTAGAGGSNANKTLEKDVEYPADFKPIPYYPTANDTNKRLFAKFNDDHRIKTTDKLEDK
ncbi:hypothetical protein FOA52_008081 [Chlamydomonas sp. UWO 241]|nr:hypothetical protein FOA52_008081 [Chlamydomonas sp. UWO 241]